MLARKPSKPGLLSRGMRVIPWAQVEDKHGLRGCHTARDSWERAEIGEAAIELLERLDVPLDWQRRLTSVWVEGGDMVATLQGLQAGTIDGEPEWLGLNPGTTPREKEEETE